MSRKCFRLHGQKDKKPSTSENHQHHQDKKSPTSSGQEVTNIRRTRSHQHQKDKKSSISSGGGNLGLEVWPLEGAGEEDVGVDEAF